MNTDSKILSVANIIWLALIEFARDCSLSTISGSLTISVAIDREVLPNWYIVSTEGGSRPTLWAFKASTYVPDAPLMNIVSSSSNLIPAVSSRVKCPALMAPNVLAASKKSSCVMMTPSWRCRQPSVVVILDFTISPFSRAVAIAAITPVPVIPFAMPCIGPSSITVPVLISIESPSPTSMSSPRTLHFQ